MSDKGCREIQCEFLDHFYRSCNPNTCLPLKPYREKNCPDCGGSMSLHNWWCRTAKHFQFDRQIHT